MIIIDYYNDVDLLKEAIASEEKRIKKLRNFTYEIEKAEQELRKARINNNKEEYNSRKKDLESLKEAQEKYYRDAHKLAIQNIVKDTKFTLSEYEKIATNRLDLEQRIHSKILEYTKEENYDKRKLLKEEIDLEKRELEFATKYQEFVGKRLDFSKKIDAYSAVNAKRITKELEIEKKKLKIEEDKLELQRRVEAGDITSAEYKDSINSIRKEERSINNQQALNNWGNSITKELGQTITNTINKGLNQINVAIQDVTSHRTGIMARLQGIGGGEYNYEGLLDTVGSNLAVSPYITQKAFMQKLDEAVDKGIAYNVEQRAFLSTISDSIATTFDAFDSSLLRLIKLQQADSTAARLGMEAALTRTLNSVFSDTSYLSDMYDSISAAIVESESLMTRNAATEFEYVVQKWMGALYSLGASNELVSQVAQGINYIGTGNIQALASNSPLQTLFAMSASRGGLDYSDLLVKGLDASNTNKLLKSMVEYLKEIAEDNRNNNVVKAAYGDLYNMSLADMRAITSLSQSDISSIYSQNMSYSDMQGSLASQFDAISKRLSTGEMIKNVIDNFVYSTGSEIAENAISYTLWQVTDLIENSTGGIHLPAISVFGNMVDLSAFTIEGMMKTGLVGLATLGQIGNIVSSIGNKGGLNLNAWDYTDMLQRGQVEEQTVGSISSTSGSTYVGSSSSSDMRNSSIAAATEDSSEVSEITNAGSENEYSFDDWYRAILIDNDPIYIKSADEYSAHDIYKAMYKDKTPVPVTVDQNTGLGAILMNLTAYMTSINRITDVNIKKVDMPVPTTVYKLDNKLKEEIKNYIKTTYLDQLATELREALIGQTRGLGNATIAKVCDKILNDKVDVEVKNNNFDRFLDIQSGFVG